MDSSTEQCNRADRLVIDKNVYKCCIPATSIGQLVPDKMKSASQCYDLINVGVCDHRDASWLFAGGSASRFRITKPHPTSFALNVQLGSEPSLQDHISNITYLSNEYMSHTY